MPSAQWKIREIPFVSTRYTFCKSQRNITTLPLARESVNVQRLFKFSGNLTETQRGFIGGTVALHFMMYNQPYGGSAYSRETPNVHPDAEGGYTVLLGETTMGGLPADIVAPVESTGLGYRFQDNRNNHACCWWKCLPRSNRTP